MEARQARRTKRLLAWVAPRGWIDDCVLRSICICRVLLWGGGGGGGSGGGYWGGNEGKAM